MFPGAFLCHTWEGEVTDIGQRSTKTAGHVLRDRAAVREAIVTLGQKCLEFLTRIGPEHALSVKGLLLLLVCTEGTR